MEDKRLQRNEADNSAILEAIIRWDSIPVGFCGDLICSDHEWQLLTNTGNSRFYRVSLIHVSYRIHG